MQFNFIEALKNRAHNEKFIWLCNIGAEKYWHDQIKIFGEENKSPLVNSIEEINLLLCKKQDIMILRNMPDSEYLKNAERNGFEIPIILCPTNKDENLSISELVLKDEKLLSSLKNINDKFVYFVPYAVTELEERIAEICGLTILGASSEICRKVNDKVFNREIAERLQLPITDGIICNSLDDIMTHYLGWKYDSNKKNMKFVLKNPYNASGKGMFIVENEKQLRIILSMLKKSNVSGRWLLEKWYENKIDLNYQLFISKDGDVDIFSVKRQFVNKTVYVGSMIPSGLKQNVLKQLESYGKQIGEYLFSIGYTGIASIDSMVIEDIVIPIIEINARFTLSTYLSFLRERFNCKYVLFKYFDIISQTPVSYQDILHLIEEKMYSKSNVFICAPSLLPEQRSKYEERYIGRLFVLFYENSKEKLQENVTNFKQCVVKKINGY